MVAIYIYMVYQEAISLVSLLRPPGFFGSLLDASRLPLQLPLSWWVFREASMPSVVNASPLFFSPFFCSIFFCAIVDLSQSEIETSFSGLLVLLPAYLRLFGSFSWSVLARSWASWKYFSSSLAERVLEYGLLYKLRNKRGKRRNGHTRTLNATALVRVARSKS